MTDSITNSANSYKALLRGVKNWGNNKKQPVTSVPFIDTAPDNTVLFRFFGQSEIATFTFNLFYDNTDISAGTYGSSVVTITQQIAFLRDQIYTDEYNTSWTLVQDRYYSGAGVTVVITDMNFSEPGGSPDLVVGRMSVQRGSIGAV